jgi:hypothetical protein
MTIPWWDQKHRVVCKKHEKIEKVTSSQDDDSVVGIKNIGSSAKNTKRSKKSQALRMTIPWWGSKTSGRLQKTRKDRKVTSSQDDDSVVGSKTLGRLQKTRKDRKSHKDDDSVVGIKNIGSSSKNTKRSKKSQALRMTILWWGSKTLGRRQKTRKERRRCDPNLIPIIGRGTTFSNKINSTEQPNKSRKINHLPSRQTGDSAARNFAHK